MKQSYAGDPFPLTQSLEEEEMAWIPHEAQIIGVEFLATKLPHTPTEVITDFLRKMNEVWRRREKRKIGRIRREYDDVLGEEGSDLLVSATISDIIHLFIFYVII